ncbi:MAG: KxYKxGKxW signal peptide domain-containing protein [Thermomicrobiales bacterium]
MRNDRSAGSRMYVSGKNWLFAAVISNESA